MGYMQQMRWVVLPQALKIAVPPGAPKGIHSFADLTRPDLKVVVCARQHGC